jgi:uncharacterized membrane protein
LDLDPNLRDLLDLVARWVHLIAGIMWVGNSMLFNWLDRNLVKPDKPSMDGTPPDMLEGEIWMVHSGGFYQVEKKQLAPSGMPKMLHWFKWQSYTTWMSGFLLLLLVYYVGNGGAFLIDPNVSSLTPGQGTMVGLGALVGGFLVYDLLWRSPLAKHPSVAIGVCFVVLAGIVYGLTHLLSGRAAYIHVGALMGTIMAGNVFFHIVPSQRELIAATLRGKTQDLKLGKHAKQRSIHNNYMTFPVLFMMLSNHFPNTYGNAQSWLILAVIIAAGAGVRHWMNVRFTYNRWLPMLAATVALGFGLLYFLVARTPAGAAVKPTDNGEKVSFTTVRLVIGQRCQPCHSQTPTDKEIKAAPSNIMFDTPAQIKMYSERIKARAVISKTMPLANRTSMSQDERDLLARWFFQGAPTTDGP